MMADSNLCILCGRKFTARKNLFAHYRGVHKLQPHTRATIRCPKEGCRFSCNFLANLRIHVEQEHNTPMVKEVLLFESPEEFQEWKTKEEKETKSSFVQHCGAKRTKGGTERITFVCHRSGKFQSSSTGKRLLKSQGSIKLGSHCTAAIELHREESGDCTVVYFKTHFGHEQHIGLLQLSRSDREAIARQIAKGVHFEKILDDVKSSIHSGEPERLHLITRRDLHNIKRDFGIGGTRQQDIDEVNGQNERPDTNSSQLRRLEYKLQLLRRRISSGMMSRETKCKVEKEVDRLLSLTQSDFSREVPHSHNSKKLKVLRISEKSNINSEVPHSLRNEKLKVLQTPDKPNIHRKVPHCFNKEKLEVLPIPIKPKTFPRSIFVVPAHIEKPNSVIVKEKPNSEVKTVHVGFDHTYCQS
ncbi:uncharacterized protein LOC126285389 [Schistocerca gregaria]|uniref:uncharacterized protein LOC126285389 n=1 Tax=Schistocerca gregaria TaxID=7010 RepID=UPI00211F2101|nr:uncharacterized protein LOC126285389 [Schistocerca gregaria]